MRVQCGYVVALEFVRKLDRAIRASDNFSNAGYGGWSAYTGCSDIDECAAGTHDCPVICVNNDGAVTGDGTAKHLTKYLQVATSVRTALARPPLGRPVCFLSNGQGKVLQYLEL